MAQQRNDHHFVDKLLQPIARQQKSYLKDITDFINYIENMKLPVDVNRFVSMDVRSLYTKYTSK